MTIQNIDKLELENPHYTPSFYITRLLYSQQLDICENEKQFVFTLIPFF